MWRPGGAFSRVYVLNIDRMPVGGRATGIMDAVAPDSEREPNGTDQADI